MKLNKPPIKSVIIGISCDGLFKNSEEIKCFYNNSKLKEMFKENQEVNNVLVQMGDEPKFVKNTLWGYVFVNDDKKEQIHIELNKLMFIDSNDYTTFNDFFKKFQIILSEIFKYKKCNLCVSDIGLRYVNEFLFSKEKLEQRFLIKQILNLKDENIFGKSLNSLFINNIQSTANNNMYAVVKTIMDEANAVSSKIVFDIDTHLNLPYTIDNIERFKNDLLKLKDFKNQIFFSNFKDIKSIEEFQ